MKKRAFCISLAMIGILVNSHCYGSDFTITYPEAGKEVSGKVIEVRGTGAAAAGAKIEVRVLTNDWYPQDGEATIKSDGSWTYAPCYLSGKGEFNNHTIEAKLIDSTGKELSTATVANIKRKP